MPSLRHRNPAALVEHQSEWPRRAELLLARIRTALRDLSGTGTASFDHIGSTAVPGLAAKPLIDLQVQILPLPDKAALIERLAPLGFVRTRGSRPDSPGVDRDIPRGSTITDSVVWNKSLFWSEKHQAILHIRRTDSPWGQYTVWLRDWLRANSEARERNESVKRALSAQQIGKADYVDYTRAKTAFSDEVQAEFEGWAVES
ncbi:GrpB family protein [Microbacterium keratanolyticum]